MSVEETVAFAGPGMLRSRTVYFAHPIDMARLTTLQQVRMTALARGLQALGAVIYDPAGAFSVGPGAQPSKIISKINNTALRAADCVVACYPETPGVGTAMEIQLADSLGMPILVLTGSANASWALAGLENGRLTEEANHSDYSWLAEEVEEYLAVRGPEPEPLETMLVKADRPEYVPVRKHADDAAFDLFVAAPVSIEPGEIVDVPAGCAVSLPEQIWALILGRSSSSRTHKLLVHPGVIDTGYRGALFVQVENAGSTEHVARIGDRIGQLIPLPNLAMMMRTVETDALGSSERGANGFGSTGR